MRVTQIAAVDIEGGAARAAYRLHQELLHLGLESRMFVQYRLSPDPLVHAFKPPMDFFSRARRRLRRHRLARDFLRYRASRPPAAEHFSDDRSEHGSDPLSQLPPSDLVNLHWVASFLDYGAFLPALSRRMPVVWTLHDMSVPAGGCHYDQGCQRYAAGCGRCPQLGSTEESDLSHQIWLRKQRILRQIPSGRLHIVAPSTWIARVAAESPLTESLGVTVIPYGVDAEIFAPQDRNFARHTLGLPQDSKVILFIAGTLTDPRKGLHLLERALTEPEVIPDLFLLMAGSGDPVIRSRLPHAHVPLVRNDRLLSVVYSAADLVVVPSRQDNLPNTVLESFACGVPVVAFAVGGIPDMVRPGITGTLVNPGDISALRRAVLELLHKPGMQAAMAENCRRIAIEEYGLAVQARRYAELYTSLCTS